MKFVCMRCGARICCSPTEEAGAVKSCRACKFQFLELYPADKDFKVRNYRLCKKCADETEANHRGGFPAV